MVKNNDSLEIKSYYESSLDYVHQMERQVFGKNSKMPSPRNIVQILTHYMLNQSRDTCSLDPARGNNHILFYGLWTRAICSYAGQDLVSRIESLDDVGDYISIKKSKRNKATYWADDELAHEDIFEAFTKTLKDNENRYPKSLAKGFWTLFYPINRDWYCCKFSQYADNFLGNNFEPTHKKVLCLENEIIPALDSQYHDALEEIGKIAHRLLIE